MLAYSAMGQRDGMISQQSRKPDLDAEVLHDGLGGLLGLAPWGVRPEEVEEVQAVVLLELPQPAQRLV
jgi:hypothetical protein